MDDAENREIEAIDFPIHKNLQKSNKPFSQRKYKEITRPKYKCPASNNNCYECCWRPRNSKESRKANKTKVLAKRREPIVEDLDGGLSF
jgi:hypothetical protein